MEDFGSHLAMSAIIVWLIQRVKSSQKIPWVHNTTDRLNRILAMILAVIASFGIHFEPIQRDAITHSATIHITGLGVSSIADGIWGSVQNFVLQQLTYHGFVKNGK